MLTYVVLLELVVIVDQIAERKVQLSIRRLLFLPRDMRKVVKIMEYRKIRGFYFLPETDRVT